MLDRTQVSARTAWHGVILWRKRDDNDIEILCRWDRLRKQWDLPKGGQKEGECAWATARRELHEETDVWIGWREAGEWMWVSSAGNPIVEPRSERSAWVVTQLKEGDEQKDCSYATWFTRADCEERLRPDHWRLLRQLSWFADDSRVPSLAVIS